MTDTSPDGRRVLGVVPGKPVAGERKEPEEQDLVMVWPHLLVRHAVAAMAGSPPAGCRARRQLGPRSTLPCTICSGSSCNRISAS